MLRTYRLFAIAAALAAPLFAPPAHAGIDACGNINVEASAKCEAKVGAACTAQCTPVNFELACHGELQASCEGECTATLPSCQGSCEGDCNAECEIDPPSFQCEGSCKADCEGSCSGHCSAQTNQAECEGSCKATCSSECTAKCTGTPGSAECSGKCQASCQGSCSAEAHMDCQIRCQSRGYAQCQSRLQGGCTAQCSQPEGALFCDSNYVDHGGNLAECKAAIDAFIKAHIQASASGNANCEGNTCTAEGKAACKCSRVAPTPPTNFGAFTVAGLTALAIAARRRSRRH
jgi:hypothetical protein